MKTFTASTTVSAKKIADQVITAVEGGIGYWCVGFHLVSSEHTPQEKPWYADPKLYEGAFDIRVTLDDEHTTGEGVEYHLTPEKVQAGLDWLAKSSLGRISEIINDEGDADTADVFIQACLFQEIIYG